MLIRGQDPLNVYPQASLVDHVDKIGNLNEGEWQKDITGNIYCPLQTPGNRHNTENFAKATRDEFKDYFITEGAPE